MATVLKAGAIKIDLEANAKNLITGFKDALGSLTSFGQGTEKTTSQAKRLDDQMKALARRKQLLVEKMKVLEDAGQKNSIAYKTLGASLAGVNDKIGTQTIRINENNSKKEKSISLTDRLKGAIAGFGEVIATTVKGLAGLGAGLLAIGGFGLKASADMEQLKTSLKTAMGGNQKVTDDAFNTIKEFAKKTPYELGEVMQAFIKLKNMGLNPSQKALTAYGDTASAMGKSLNDMVEAVADAATGEFERLKEFGIRASSQGDKVSFTFKGVTKTVKKESKAIENYLIGLGETNFTGGMDAQSKTISGQMSTLKDNIYLTFADLSEKSGLSGFVRNGLGKLNEELSKVDIDSLIKSFQSFFDTVRKPTNKLIDGFEQIPRIIQDLVTAITTYFAQEIAGLKNIFQIFTTQILPQLVNWFGIIAGVLIWVGSNVLVALMYAWEQLREPVMQLITSLFELWGAISPIITVILALVGALLVGLMPVLQIVWAYLIQAFSGIVQMLSGAIKIIAGIFNIFLGLFEATFMGKPERFINGFKQLWQGLVQFMGGLWTLMKASIQAIVDGIGNTLKSIDLIKVGKDMIQGLINGISGMASKVKDEVSKLGNLIPNQIKSVLSIKSPSRVLMQVGMDAAEGLEIGLADSQPNIEAQVSSMSNLISGVSAQDGKPSNTTINKQRNVTINNYDSSRDSRFINFSTAFA